MYLVYNVAKICKNLYNKYHKLLGQSCTINGTFQKVKSLHAYDNSKLSVSSQSGNFMTFQTIKRTIQGLFTLWFKSVENARTLFLI